VSGGNGSDVYSINAPIFSGLIDNIAKDERADILDLKAVAYETLKVDHDHQDTANAGDLVITGSGGDTKIQVKQYFKSSERQHLVIKTKNCENVMVISDQDGNVTLAHLAIDRSEVETDQLIDVSKSVAYSSFPKVVGSQTGANHILGLAMPIVIEGKLKSSN
jgi:hypothetical protein